MWGQKSSAFVRAVKQAPSTISNAGVKSFSGLAKAGNIAMRAPDAFGQAAAALGRIVRKDSDEPASLPQRKAIVPHRSLGRVPRTVIIFGVSLVVATAAGIIDWMYESLHPVSIGGLLSSTVLMATFVSLARWVWGEVRAWQSLSSVEQLQSDLSSPCETSEQRDRFQLAFLQLRARVNEPQLLRFMDGANPAVDLAGLRDALDRTGLQGMDRGAIDVIRAGTRDVFFLSLISFNSLGEVVVFSLRAFALIRRVASAYGYRPGRFGLVRLVRHIFTDIALLPVGMLVALEVGRETGSAIRNATHVGVQAVGAAHPLAGVAVGAIGNAVGAVAEGVTPRVADATLAAGRMAHLGLLTAAIVRPVTFSASRYGEMRNIVYREILGLRRDAVRSRKRGDEEPSQESA